MTEDGMMTTLGEVFLQCMWELKERKQCEEKVGWNVKNIKEGGWI